MYGPPALLNADKDIEPVEQGIMVGPLILTSTNVFVVTVITL